MASNNKSSTPKGATEKPTQNEPSVLVTRPSAGVAVLTLNRPKQLNAISAKNAFEVYERVVELQKDESVRCVVLTGSGRGFCSGADLSGGAGGFHKFDANGKQIKLSPGESVAYNMEVAYNPMTKALYELEKPLIVAVNGVAAGGGVGLALLGDIVLAAESSKFINVFAPKLGLAPDLGATWTLPRVVGRPQAMAMSLLGEPVSAKEAERLGMIYKTVPDAELMTEALKLAEKLAKAPTIAFYETRKMFDSSWTRTFQQQLDEELRTQGELGDMPDFMIGVKTFRGETKNAFTGKRSKL